MAEVPTWQRVVAIPGMLIFGTATVVTQKFLFEQKANGRDCYVNPHKFAKPWFQTNSMFIGMLLALLVYEVQSLIKKRKQKDVDSTQSLASQAEDLQKENSEEWKMYFYVAGPAICDLTATALMNIGLLYIQASVWQMLRGSMVLFSSIFCAFILKRPHFAYMWWSVLLIVIALTIVGVAAVCSTGVGKDGVTQGQVIMAIALTVGSQIIQASQIVVEDFLLHDMTAAPVLIVGLEGMWGTIITCTIFLPIIQNIGGEEGNGVHEDTLDTFRMIGNSPTLLVWCILYVFFILLYNVTGMFVTNITSAVVRTILEGLRTLCIWIVQLIIFYSVRASGSESGSTIGEEWTIWSWMQLAGFLLLFTGMLLYNKIIKIPIFKYPSDIPKQSKIDDTPLVAKKDA
jgi:type II secretory pathway pseudopilin PulG